VPFAKIGSVIKSNFSAIGSFFSDSWSELKKVRWPSRQELTSYTIVVVVTVVIVTVYFWLLDLGFSRIIDWILK
jgi:preprotein translocase subunit SecE